MMNHIHQKSDAYLLLHTPTRLLELLYSKYGDIEEDFNLLLMNQLVYNRKSHLNSLYKEHNYSDYVDEFLKRFYTIDESAPRFPKLSNYYKNYHLFFLRPILRSWTYNNLLNKYNDNKAEVFYKQNYISKKSNIHDANLPSESSSNDTILTNNKTIFDSKIRYFIDKEGKVKYNQNGEPTISLTTLTMDNLGNNNNEINNGSINDNKDDNRKKKKVMEFNRNFYNYSNNFEKDLFSKRSKNDSFMEIIEGLCGDNGRKGKSKGENSNNASHGRKAHKFMGSPIKRNNFIIKDKRIGSHNNSKSKDNDGVNNNFNKNFNSVSYAINNNNHFRKSHKIKEVSNTRNINSINSNINNINKNNNRSKDKNNNINHSKEADNPTTSLSGTNIFNNNTNNTNTKLNKPLNKPSSTQLIINQKAYPFIKSFKSNIANFYRDKPKINNRNSNNINNNTNKNDSKQKIQTYTSYLLGKTPINNNNNNNNNTNSKSNNKKKHNNLSQYQNFSNKNNNKVYNTSNKHSYINSNNMLNNTKNNDIISPSNNIFKGINNNNNNEKRKINLIKAPKTYNAFSQVYKNNNNNNSNNNNNNYSTNLNNNSNSINNSINKNSINIKNVNINKRNKRSHINSNIKSHLIISHSHNNKYKNINKTNNSSMKNKNINLNSNNSSKPKNNFILSLRTSSTNLKKTVNPNNQNDPNKIHNQKNQNNQNKNNNLNNNINSNNNNNHNNNNNQNNNNNKQNSLIPSHQSQQPSSIPTTLYINSINSRNKKMSNCSNNISNVNNNPNNNQNNNNIYNNIYNNFNNNSKNSSTQPSHSINCTIAQKNNNMKQSVSTKSVDEKEFENLNFKNVLCNSNSYHPYIKKNSNCNLHKKCTKNNIARFSDKLEQLFKRTHNCNSNLSCFQGMSTNLHLKAKNVNNFIFNNNNVFNNYNNFVNNFNNGSHFQEEIMMGGGNNSININGVNINMNMNMNGNKKGKGDNNCCCRNKSNYGSIINSIIASSARNDIIVNKKNTVHKRVNSSKNN